jgi:hypothetical protein
MIFRVVTLISFGMIGGWLGWMANDRQIPVRYYSTEVVNTPKPGQVLRVKSVVWRDKSCQTSVYRLIFDDEGHRHVVTDLEFPAGVLPLGNDTFVAPVPISSEASDGPGIYRVVRRYRCNLLQSIWPIEDGPHDVQFTIAPR